MLAAGLTNAEIADRLVVTHHTAEKYVSELKARYGARDRVELVLRCQMEVGERAPRMPDVSDTAEPFAEGLPGNVDLGSGEGERHWWRGLTLVAGALGVFAGFVAAAGLLGPANDGSFAVPAGEAERLGGGDREQQAAFADGKVTPGEYSAAYQRMLDCFDAANIPYVVSTDLHGSPQYSAGPFESKAELDAASLITDACYAEHFRGTDVARAAAER